MIGCVLATVGVISLLKMAHHRHHRHGYGYGYGCGGGWRRHALRHHLRGGGFGEHDSGPGGPYGADEAGSGFDDEGMRGGFGGWGRRFILRGVLDRLEATPAQEKVIVAAADEFHDEAKKFRGELRKSRGDVAAAFRKPSFDEVLLGELYARHDTAIEGLRKAFVGLGAKVHDALDEKQRARLADLIESGHRGFGGGFGGGFFRPRFGRGGFDRRAWDW